MGGDGAGDGKLTSGAVIWPRLAGSEAPCRRELSWGWELRADLRRLFALLPFAHVMGAPVLRPLFALLPFATIPFMFIHKEDSFSDVIRRKAAQKAALLFFYSRPPQAGTFSYKSPAAGRLLSAPYQSAARAPLFYIVPFPLFAKRHGSVRPSRSSFYRAFSPFSQKAR